jgi:co-chaperonin GroES (HSP10)
LVKLSEVPVTKGRVAFEAPWINEIGAKAGDIVGFRKNMDYRVNIDGKEYYRTRAEDLLYVEI